MSYKKEPLYCAAGIEGRIYTIAETSILPDVVDHVYDNVLDLLEFPNYVFSHCLHRVKNKVRSGGGKADKGNGSGHDWTLHHTTNRGKHKKPKRNKNSRTRIGRY